MKKTEIEDWEKPHIRRYLFRFVIAGLAGMLALVVVALLFKHAGYGPPALGLVFLPWLIVGAMIIPVVYHEGVTEGRKHEPPSRE